MRTRRVFRAASILVLVAAVAAVGARFATAARPRAVNAQPRMSLAEEAGQLVMVRVHGTALSHSDRLLIERAHIGNVILFGDDYANPQQLRSFTGAIQDAVRAANRLGVGAIVAIDQEGGVVKRLPDLPPWYSAPRIGSSGSSALAFNQGAQTGSALGADGVVMDLAPVADLDEGPNHVMGARSFGSLPSRTGRLAAAFVRGLQSARVAATVKHFPGLGGATINSDDGAAYVDRTGSELHNDRGPFAAAVASHVKAIMVSHGIYEGAGSHLPASLDPAIATGWLRDRLGFNGVAISDSLNALGWRFGGDVAAACPATIAAGVDIALVTGTASVARACAANIVRAVREGTIARSRFEQAVRRVLALKGWLGLTHSAAAAPADPPAAMPGCVAGPEPSATGAPEPA